MSGGNAWKYRPEVQARMIANLNNPEYMRRKAIYRKATGQKKRLVAEWNVAWNTAGRPADFPDFEQWREQNKVRIDARRKEELASQRRCNEGHAKWLAERVATGAA